MALKDATNKLLNTIDIIDVIGQDTNLTARENNDEYIGSCPFHTDVNPSFSVNAKKQVFHCFSCGRSGNLITYVMYKQQLDFIGALKYLAEDYDISLDNILTQEDQEMSAKRKAYIELMLKVQEYFKEQLFKHPNELKYLQEERQLSIEDIKKFNIGFDDGNLYKYLSDNGNGYLFTELQEQGLVQLKNNRITDFFNNRITFPITDKRNNIIGFSARSINGMPKYKNSQNNYFFQKNEVLYNYKNAQDALKESKDDNKDLYLFEGQNDVISAMIAGKESSIASLGTSLTDNQIGNILNLCQNIVITYDGDAAGHKAILRAANNFKVTDHDVKLSVVRLPDGLDPDDYRKKYGKEKLNQALSNKIPIVDYLIQNAKDDFEKTDKSTPERSRFYDKCKDIIYHYANIIEQQMYLHDLNKEFGIENNEAVQNQDVQKYENDDKDNNSKNQINYYKNKNNNNENENFVTVNHYKTTIEDKLLSYILKQNYDKQVIDVLVKYFNDVDYRKILLSLHDDKIQLTTYQEMLIERANNNYINFTQETFMATLKQMYLEYDYKATINKINSQIEEAISENDINKIAKLSKEKVQLNNLQKMFISN